MPTDFRTTKASACLKSAQKYLMGYALCRQPLTIAIALRWRILGFFCKHTLDLWCADLSFGMLGASSLASWDTLGRSLGTRRHKQGHFAVQASICLDLGWISGVHNIESFSSTLTKKGVFLNTCFQVAFSSYLKASPLPPAPLEVAF